MNKYIFIIGAIAVILGGGIVYRVFFLPQEYVPVSTGIVREFTVTARKDRWEFKPDVIEINRGDRVKMRVVNEDDYDHGFGIDAFGVTKRMPANETIEIEFTATQAGEFPFYCSVPCGEGLVDGKKREHADMIGTLKVKDIIQPQ